MTITTKNKLEIDYGLWGSVIGPLMILLLVIPPIYVRLHSFLGGLTGFFIITVYMGNLLFWSIIYPSREIKGLEKTMQIPQKQKQNIKQEDQVQEENQITKKKDPKANEVLECPDCYNQLRPGDLYCDLCGTKLINPIIERETKIHEQINEQEVVEQEQGKYYRQQFKELKDGYSAFCHRNMRTKRIEKSRRRRQKQLFNLDYKQNNSSSILKIAGIVFLIALVYLTWENLTWEKLLYSLSMMFGQNQTIISLFIAFFLVTCYLALTKQGPWM